MSNATTINKQSSSSSSSLSSTVTFSFQHRFCNKSSSSSSSSSILNQETYDSNTNDDLYLQQQQQQQVQQHWSDILGLKSSSSSLSNNGLNECAKISYRHSRCCMDHCIHNDDAMQVQKETDQNLDVFLMNHCNHSDCIASASASINMIFGMGIIIDHNNVQSFNDRIDVDSTTTSSNDCDSTSRIQSLLDRIHTIRCTLPLDSKRPTVHRRFYHDVNGIMIAKEIERIVYEAITNTTTTVPNTKLEQLPQQQEQNNESQNGMKKHVHWIIYCNRYLRILEYHSIGSELLPHTDGIKICDTTQMKSTHTLLLYLSNCSNGGETVLINPNYTGWSKYTNVVVPFDRIYHPINDMDIARDNNNNNNSNNNGAVSESTHSFRSIVDITSNGINLSCRNNDMTQEQKHQQLLQPDHSTDIDNNCNICLLGISPKVGRILLFPHDWSHAGAMIESIPKIVLRAEITIQHSTI